jgi:hypothetical protein
VTQLSHRLLEDLGVRGALRTLLLLVVVWSAWVGTAWITNWFDPDRLPVRLMLVGVMLASLFMSAAMPDAFGERGLMFALAYVAIQVGRTAFVLIALGGTHQLSTNFQRVLSWYVASGVLWIMGGFWKARYVLWGLALIMDFCGPVVGAVAAADELTVAHPSDAGTPASVELILGGTALFRVGMRSSGGSSSGCLPEHFSVGGRHCLVGDPVRNQNVRVLTRHAHSGLGVHA